MHKLLLLLFLSSLVASGQTNSITVTASRSTNPQADQIVFGVYLATGLDATREDALAAVQAAGITLANFGSVVTNQQYLSNGQATHSSLAWSFSLPVALSSMKRTIGLLSAVQASVAKTNNGMSLSFSIQGTQVSPQLQQSQTCSLSDLIDDARAQGRKMASAAGMSLGLIQAMSSATVTTPGGQAFGLSAYLQPVCSLTVKFALGAF
jgi:hypothetical protein